jgi:hypothetical protein
VAQETSTSGVVVAVGDSHLAAQAIAQERGFPVVHTSESGLTTQERQTLDRVSPDRAIVVGHDVRATAEGLRTLGITVSDQISARTRTDRFVRATYQQWDAADSVFVVGDSTVDRRRAALAVNGSPVISAQSGESDIREVLSYLGASEVYVTPDVSTSLRDSLRDDYTVSTTVRGGDLTDNLYSLSRDLASDGEDIVVTNDENVMHATETHIRHNTSVVVGADAGDFPTSDVYLIGYDPTNLDVATDRVWSYEDLGPTVWALDRNLPVLVSETERVGDETIDVRITNVGDAETESASAYAVKASWSGTIESSSPNGTTEAGDYVITWDTPVQPGSTLTATLTVNRVSNQGHPRLDYFGGSTSDGLLPSGTSPDLPFLSTLPSLWVTIATIGAIGVLLVTALYGFFGNRR